MTAGGGLGLHDAPNVPFAGIPDLLRPMFVKFRADRRAGEGFGDWVNRIGFESLRESTATEVSA